MDLSFSGNKIPDFININIATYAFAPFNIDI